MSQETGLAQRVAVLEKELAEVKQRLDQFISQVTWFDRVEGSLKDEPEFGEVLKPGRAIREADRPSEREGSL